MIPVLETERLLLREIMMTDAQAIYSCFSNKEVIRYYGHEAITSIQQAEQFITFFEKNFKDKRGIRWGIERKDTKQLIGTIGFNAWSPKHHRAEIGYELHPNFWRKGYAKEAIIKVIDYGFNGMELNRIGAIVFTENHASNELLLHLRFVKEGILRNYMTQNGKSYDTNVYSVVR